MKFLDEFKKFATRGSVIDLAIGVMIGNAFNKIVSSLVEDIVMPFISLITGGIKFSDYKWILRAKTDQTAEIAFNYGKFFQVVFDFFIIALSMFLAIKIVNKLRDKYEKTLKKKRTEEAMHASEEIQLLKEIRDALKKKT